MTSSAWTEVRRQQRHAVPAAGLPQQQHLPMKRSVGPAAGWAPWPEPRPPRHYCRLPSGPCRRRIPVLRAGSRYPDAGHARPDPAIYRLRLRPARRKRRKAPEWSRPEQRGPAASMSLTLSASQAPWKPQPVKPAPPERRDPAMQSSLTLSGLQPARHPLTLSAIQPIQKPRPAFPPQLFLQAQGNFRMGSVLRPATRWNRSAASGRPAWKGAQRHPRHRPGGRHRPTAVRLTRSDRFRRPPFFRCGPFQILLPTVRIPARRHRWDRPGRPLEPRRISLLPLAPQRYRAGELPRHHGRLRSGPPPSDPPAHSPLPLAGFLAGPTDPVPVAVPGRHGNFIQHGLLSVEQFRGHGFFVSGRQLLQPDR